MSITPAERERVCRKKARFNTQEHATREMNELTWQGHQDLQVYQCEVCGTWHVGHTFDATRSIKANARRRRQRKAERERMAQ